MNIVGAFICVDGFEIQDMTNDMIFIGEVGLTGEVRPVAFIETRVKEAMRQGFKQFVIPEAQAELEHIKDIVIHPVGNIYDLYTQIKQAGATS